LKIGQRIGCLEFSKMNCAGAGVAWAAFSVGWDGGGEAGAIGRVAVMHGEQLWRNCMRFIIENETDMGGVPEGVVARPRDGELPRLKWFHGSGSVRGRSGWSWGRGEVCGQRGLLPCPCRRVGGGGRPEWLLGRLVGRKRRCRGGGGGRRGGAGGMRGGWHLHGGGERDQMGRGLHVGCSGWW
jgi:hypothetical protein